MPAIVTVVDDKPLRRGRSPRQALTAEGVPIT